MVPTMAEMAAMTNFDFVIGLSFVESANKKYRHLAVLSIALIAQLIII